MDYYTIIVKIQGKQDIVRKDIDRLNSIVIAGELQLAYQKEIEQGIMSVEVIKQ